MAAADPTWEDRAESLSLNTLTLQNGRAAAATTPSPQEGRPEQPGSPPEPPPLQTSAETNRKAPSGAPTSAAVDAALLDALHQPKNRTAVLRLEADVEAFLGSQRQQHNFSSDLSGYQRLLAHRIAQHYGLETCTVDMQGGEQCRVVAKKPAKKTVMPRPKVQKLAEVPVSAVAPRGGLDGEEAPEDLARRVLLKKGSGGGPGGGAGAGPGAIARSTSNTSLGDGRSLQEREEEYMQTRQRIFAPSGDVVPPVTPSPASARPTPGHTTPSGAAAQRGSRPASLPLPKGRPAGDAPGGAGGGNSRKAVFRNREEELKDPDFKRGQGRWPQPQLVPGYNDFYMVPPPPQPGVYMPRGSYTTEFPGLPSQQPVQRPLPPLPHMGGALPGQMLVPLGPDGLPLRGPLGVPGMPASQGLPHEQLLASQAPYAGMPPGQEYPHQVMHSAAMPGSLPMSPMQHSSPYPFHSAGVPLYPAGGLPQGAGAQYPIPRSPVHAGSMPVHAGGMPGHMMYHPQLVAQQQQMAAHLALMQQQQLLQQQQQQQQQHLRRSGAPSPQGPRAIPVHTAPYSPQHSASGRASRASSGAPPGGRDEHPLGGRRSSASEQPPSGRHRRGDRLQPQSSGGSSGTTHSARSQQPPPPGAAAVGGAEQPHRQQSTTPVVAAQTPAGGQTPAGDQAPTADQAPAAAPAPGPAPAQQKAPE